MHSLGFRAGATSLQGLGTPGPRRVDSLVRANVKETKASSTSASTSASQQDEPASTSAGNALGLGHVEEKLAVVAGAAAIGGGVGYLAEENGVVDWTDVQELLDDALYAVSQQVDTRALPNVAPFDLSSIPGVAELSAMVDEAVYTYSQDFNMGSALRGLTTSVGLAGGSVAVSKLNSIPAVVPPDAPAKVAAADSALKSAVLDTGVTSAPMSAAAAGLSESVSSSAATLKAAVSAAPVAPALSNAASAVKAAASSAASAVPSVASVPAAVSTLPSTPPAVTASAAAASMAAATSSLPAPETIPAPPPVAPAPAVPQVAAAAVENVIPPIVSTPVEVLTPAAPAAPVAEAVSKAVETAAAAVQPVADAVAPVFAASTTPSAVDAALSAAAPMAAAADAAAAATVMASAGTVAAVDGLNSAMRSAATAAGVDTVDMEALRQQIEELEALRRSLTELKMQLPTLQAQISDLQVQQMADAASAFDPDVLGEQLGEVVGNISSGLDQQVYTASQALVEVKSSLGEAVADTTAAAGENSRLARVVRGLLDAVDGALGSAYEADSLVLGGVVIAVALSVAIRGVVVLARDDKTTAAAGGVAPVLGAVAGAGAGAAAVEPGVITRDVTALEAAAALNRDPNSILVDVRTRAEARAQGRPDMSPFRSGRAQSISIPFMEGQNPDPIFIRNVAAAPAINGRTRLFLMDGDGTVASEAAAAVKESGMRLAEASYVLDGYAGPQGWKASGLPVKEPVSLPAVKVSEVSKALTQLKERAVKVLNRGTGGVYGAGPVGGAAQAISQNWDMISKAAVSLAALQLTADKSAPNADSTAKLKSALVERFGANPSQRELIDRAFATVESVMPADASAAAAPVPRPVLTETEKRGLADEGGWYMESPIMALQEELLQVELAQAAAIQAQKAREASAAAAAASTSTVVPGGAADARRRNWRDAVFDSTVSAASAAVASEGSSRGGASSGNTGVSGWAAGLQGSVPGLQKRLSELQSSLAKSLPSKMPSLDSMSLPKPPSLDMSSLASLKKLPSSLQSMQSNMQSTMQSSLASLKLPSALTQMTQMESSWSASGFGAAAKEAASKKQAAAAPAAAQQQAEDEQAGVVVSAQLGQELASTLSWAANALGDLLTGPPVTTAPVQPRATQPSSFPSPTGNRGMMGMIKQRSARAALGRSPWAKSPGSPAAASSSAASSPTFAGRSGSSSGNGSGRASSSSSSIAASLANAEQRLAELQRLRSWRREVESDSGTATAGLSTMGYTVSDNSGEDGSGRQQQQRSASVIRPVTKSSWRDEIGGSSGSASGGSGGADVPARVRSTWRSLVDSEASEQTPAALQGLRADIAAASSSFAAGGRQQQASLQLLAEEEDGFEDSVEIVVKRH